MAVQACSGCSKKSVADTAANTGDDSGSEPHAASAPSGFPPSTEDDRAAALVESIARKSYRADACLFASAVVRGAFRGGAAPPARRTEMEEQATRFCASAAALREPPAPDLDRRLAEFSRAVVDIAADEGRDGGSRLRVPQLAAFDAAFSQLNAALSAWRTASMSKDPLRAESQSGRLAGTAMDRARALALVVAQGAPGTLPSLPKGDLASLREAIVALARHGAGHSPDDWIRIVEPNLEAFLAEAEALAGRNDSTSRASESAASSLCRSYLRLSRPNGASD